MTEILQNLRNLGAEEKKHKSAEIKEMIQYYNHMNVAEADQRTQLYQFTAQYLVIASTALGLVLTQHETILVPVFVTVLLIFGIQIFFAVLLIASYIIQSGFRYPFLKENKYGNKWKWFYYGNQPLLKMSTRIIYPSNVLSETMGPICRD